jgi:hypothetical protein
MSTIATTDQTADSIYRYGAPPPQSEGKRELPWDRRVVLSAIGQRLKVQYAIATPVSPALAALIQQLEAQK